MLSDQDEILRQAEWHANVDRRKYVLNTNGRINLCSCELLLLANGSSCCVFPSDFKGKGMMNELMYECNHLCGNVECLVKVERNILMAVLTCD